MNSLGCFKDKEKLKRELLKAVHNTGLSFFKIAQRKKIGMNLEIVVCHGVFVVQDMFILNR